jgi:hypothetical protein
MTTLPQRSHSTRRNREEKALNGCCIASCGVGSTSFP